MGENITLLNTFDTDNFSGDIKTYWPNSEDIDAKEFICPYCNEKVTSSKGFIQNIDHCIFGTDIRSTYICPECKRPVYFEKNAYNQEQQYPRTLYGENIDNLPKNLNDIYIEARKCFTNELYTATMMCCRKIILVVAETVKKDGDHTENFKSCVEVIKREYLGEQMEKLVSRVVKIANIGTHEVESISENDALASMKVIEILLIQISKLTTFKWE